MCQRKMLSHLFLFHFCIELNELTLVCLNLCDDFVYWLAFSFQAYFCSSPFSNDLRVWRITKGLNKHARYSIKCTLNQHTQSPRPLFFITPIASCKLQTRKLTLYIVCIVYVYIFWLHCIAMLSFTLQLAPSFSLNFWSNVALIFSTVLSEPLF